MEGTDYSHYRVQRKKLTKRLRQWVRDTGDKFGIPAEGGLELRGTRLRVGLQPR
jgi:hypothetical protein